MFDFLIEAILSIYFIIIMRPYLFIFAGLLILFLIPLGCSDPQRKGPSETAQVFLDALSAGDYDRAKEVCTPGTKDNLDMFATFSSLGANPNQGAFEVKREEINGEYATVYYDKEEKEHFVRLHKEDGKWFVLANKADMNSGDSDDDAKDTDEVKAGSDTEKEDPADTYKALRDGKSVKEIAEAFLKAYAYSDFEKAKQYASKESASALDMQSGLGNLSSDEKKLSTKFNIVRVEEDGDYASVYYKDPKVDGEKELKLGKDKHGNWQVIMTKSDFSE